jgi:hypothetical protein
MLILSDIGIEVYTEIKDYTKSDMKMRCSLFWDVTQRSLVVTDVMGQLIGLIFQGQVVAKLLDP